LLRTKFPNDSWDCGPRKAHAQKFLMQRLKTNWKAYHSSNKSLKSTISQTEQSTSNCRNLWEEKKTIKG
jgi:hypothetical protein